MGSRSYSGQSATLSVCTFRCSAFGLKIVFIFNLIVCRKKFEERSVFGVGWVFGGVLGCLGPQLGFPPGWGFPQSSE